MTDQAEGIHTILHAFNPYGRPSDDRMGPLVYCATARIAACRTSMSGSVRPKPSASAAAPACPGASTRRLPPNATDGIIERRLDRPRRIGLLHSSERVDTRTAHVGRRMVSSRQQRRRCAGRHRSTP